MSNSTLRTAARIGAVVVAALAAVTCTDRSADNPTDREAACSTWCERRGECFEPSDDRYPKADCVDVCIADEVWGPCGDELMEQIECFNPLACEDFIKYGSAEDAPCHDEVVRQSACSSEAGV